MPPRRRAARARHLCLRDDAAVDAGLDAALPGLAPGTPVVDHTTVLPQKVGARAAACATSGSVLARSRFHGAAAGARGERRDDGAAVHAGSWTRRPALEAMCGDLRYLGERDDLAAVYKLVGNAMILAVVGGMSDAFALPSATASDVGGVRTLLTFYSPAGQIAGRGKRMAAGDYQPTWTLDMSHKDATLMQSDRRVALPVIDAIEGAMRERSTGDWAPTTSRSSPSARGARRGYGNGVRLGSGEPLHTGRV